MAYWIEVKKTVLAKDAFCNLNAIDPVTPDDVHCRAAGFLLGAKWDKK